MSPEKTISAFPQLEKRTILAPRVHDDPILKADRLLFYASARAALFYLARMLKVSEKDTILLPAYNCGVEVEAVLRAGCGVDFFRIRKDLTMDLENLLDKVNLSTRGIVIPHYFGFSQDLSSLESICKQKGIMLIEDCAHALYSRDKEGKWLGTTGDYGLFSMRKTTFLPNGGALLINSDNRQIPGKGKHYFAFSLLKSSLKSVLEHEANGKGIPAFIASRILNSHGRHSSRNRVCAESDKADDHRWYYNVPVFDYENDISAISMFLAGKEDFRRIIEARRRNYGVMEQKLRDHLSDHFVFSGLSDGACPLSFPLFVDQRDAVVASMMAQGIEPFVFGRFLHPLINKTEFPDTQYLADNIITLPVHQQMTETDIETVADIFVKSLKGNKCYAA